MDIVRFSSGYLSDSEWAGLPLPVVFLILDKLSELVDHIRFAAVCKLWHSFARDYKHAVPRSLKALPMLLIPNECQEKNSLTNRKLVYSISQGKICNNSIQLQVPYSKRCCGSSHGWLATIDIPTSTDRGLIIALRNPLREACPIRLPPLNVKIKKHHACYYEYYVRKVILSADPTLNPDNYVVVALYGRDFCLAFIKSGQKDWTYANPRRCFLADAIFYKNRIFAVGRRGDIMSWDFNTSNNPSQPPIATLHKFPLPSTHYDVQVYLVQSSKGDLLCIQRLYEWPKHASQKLRTKSFMVHKLAFDNNCLWVNKIEVTSIGDEALFVGDNHSASVLTSNFPGCQPNSIYFTDDLLSYYHELQFFDNRPFYDMGIFNLEDGSITQHYSLNLNSQRYIPPAIWVELPLFLDSASS